MVSMKMGQIFKYGGIFLILWLSAQMFSWVNFTAPLRRYEPLRESTLPQPQSGVQRILIISPHEDDETLAIGGTIFTELNKGNQVLVVFLTNGDGFWGAEFLVEVDFLRRTREFLDFAHKRQREAIKALDTLGLPEKDVTFLGYPDHGLKPMLTTHWSCGELYRSPYTHKERSPYANSLTPRAPFCGAAVLSDIEAIISNYRPAIIYLPHPRDDHPDHRAAGEFVLRALRDLGRKDPQLINSIELRAYAVHLYKTRWPSPRGLHSELPLTPPAGLAQACTWVSYQLSPAAEQWKLRALRAYRTQRLVMGRFLSSFVRTNELYCRLQMPSGGSG